MSSLQRAAVASHTSTARITRTHTHTHTHTHVYLSQDDPSIYHDIPHTRQYITSIMDGCYYVGQHAFTVHLYCHAKSLIHMGLCFWRLMCEPLDGDNSAPWAGRRLGAETWCTTVVYAMEWVNGGPIDTITGLCFSSYIYIFYRYRYLDIFTHRYRLLWE